MNVSPAQRLVSYLREFPLVRAVERAAAPAATTQAAAVNRSTAPERPLAAAPAAPRAIATAPSAPAPAARLPRGSLLNIVT